ncbi:DUF998 domain-containing protein [Methanobrevibacter arboriphilus]|nr:DUF998 domain-containing protein [Methanobrevibacter arboriphilus]
MVSVIFYFIHVFLGQALWKEYNPITTDISSLTAVGSPNAELIGIFTLIYGICAVIFAIGIVRESFNKKYSHITKLGFIFLLAMTIISLIGYALFPLSPDKAALNFQNIMHIIITGITVLLTILFLFFIGIGFIKKEKFIKLGKISIITAILIIIFGTLNPISVALDLNILGLTERLVVFTLEIFIFFLSFIYTFNIESFLSKNKNISN